MPKTYTYEDGVTVAFDDDIDPEKVTDAGDDGIAEEEYSALVEAAEAQVDTTDLEDIDEPAPADSGGDLG